MRGQELKFKLTFDFEHVCDGEVVDLDDLPDVPLKKEAASKKAIASSIKQEAVVKKGFFDLLETASASAVKNFQQQCAE